MALPDTPDLTPPAQGGLGSRYHFMRDFLCLAGPYWTSGPQKWKVIALSLALLALTVAQVWLAIWTNYWNGALFNALGERSMNLFLKQIGTFVVIFLLTMGVTALHLYVKRLLQLGWRQWLTERVLERWMARGQHYQLIFTPGEHDNPDGRIAEDIRIITETSIALLHTLVYSILILGTFIDILMSVSRAVTVPGTQIPGYMVMLAFLYAGIGTVLGVLLGRPLVRTTNLLQTAEANFRFGLARSRENSEAIALLRGEPVERRHSLRLFDDIERTWNWQTWAYNGIVSFSSGYGALLPVFPILVAAPQFITGAITLGVLMQAAQAFQKLTSALSWPIDNLGDMAKCRASADRVLSLYTDLQKLEDAATRPDSHRITVTTSPDTDLVIHDLCITHPDGRVVLEGFNLQVHQGERVLISGDPAATITLFKVVAGIWPWGQGEVQLPREQPIYFMPQRPFVPSGILRSAMNYPDPSDTFDTEAIEHAFRCAGLEGLAARLDERDDWDRVLTAREQQRVGFARLLLRRPAWIFLEEATDAFDPAGEAQIMDMLRCELPQATVLSISFHEAQAQHHDRTLVLARPATDKYLFNHNAARQG